MKGGDDEVWLGAVLSGGECFWGFSLSFCFVHFPVGPCSRCTHAHMPTQSRSNLLKTHDIALRHSLGRRVGVYSSGQSRGGGGLGTLSGFAETHLLSSVLLGRPYFWGSPIPGPSPQGPGLHLSSKLSYLLFPSCCFLPCSGLFCCFHVTRCGDTTSACSAPSLDKHARGLASCIESRC